MNYDLQKASLLKRFSAWLLDAILLCVLATGCIWAVSDIVNLNRHTDQLNAYYEQYEAEYNISFNITREAYDAMTQEEREAYDAALEDATRAMNEDEDVMQTFSVIVQLLLLVCSIGIFLARLILDFLIPLWLRNGQTLGKKVFGLAVMRTNGVRLGSVSLFIRAILGKYTIGTMIPIFVLIMSMTGILGTMGTLMLFVLLGAQIILMITTVTNSMIHDKLSDTVVVDLSSQLIFDSPEELLAYQQRIAAEKAERQTY